MMSEEEFFAGLTGGENDLQLLVQALHASGQAFCLIGGLAVNHYVEPMVTLDADFAITSGEGAAEALEAAGFEVTSFPHSINALLPNSRLRIQITINHRYGEFPSRAVRGTLFGVEMPIASLPDVVQGKLWAATDETRRPTKRQKDALDIARLAEVYPEVFEMIPRGLLSAVDQIRPT